MALKQAKNTQTISEKRYYTIQFLESAFQNGSEVDITEIDETKISELNDETFVYSDKKKNTYVIFDTRPTVKLLQSYGWYREGVEPIPIIAYIPTHLLTDINNGEIVNELLLEGDEYTELVNTGESVNYKLEPLEIKRGTLIDIKYDFLPETKENRFYVVDSKVDTVSLNYVANLMPYKYDAKTKEELEENEELYPNNSWLKYDSKEDII